MRDVTAGRSAGSAHSPELDPTRPVPAPPAPGHVPVADVTAGTSAGTAWNAAQDPTRPAVLDDPRKRPAA
jgi:hypothetical protein